MRMYTFIEREQKIVQKISDLVEIVYDFWNEQDAARFVQLIEYAMQTRIGKCGKTPNKYDVRDACVV